MPPVTEVSSIYSCAKSTMTCGDRLDLLHAIGALLSLVDKTSGFLAWEEERSHQKTRKVTSTQCSREILKLLLCRKSDFFNASKCKQVCKHHTHCQLLGGPMNPNPLTNLASFACCSSALRIVRPYCLSSRILELSSSETASSTTSSLEREGSWP